jgi:nitrogen fixation/metabolism regulation signal transduction histidine kinase
LGLAIVRKIIDEHGARIQVENRVDEQGTVLGAQVEVVFSRLAS